MNDVNKEFAGQFHVEREPYQSREDLIARVTYLENLVARLKKVILTWFAAGTFILIVAVMVATMVDVRASEHCSADLHQGRFSCDISYMPYPCEGRFDSIHGGTSLNVSATCGSGQDEVILSGLIALEESAKTGDCSGNGVISASGAEIPQHVIVYGITGMTAAERWHSHSPQEAAAIAGNRNIAEGESILATRHVNQKFWGEGYRSKGTIGRWTAEFLATPHIEGPWMQLTGTIMCWDRLATAWGAGGLSVHADKCTDGTPDPGEWPDATRGDAPILIEEGHTVIYTGKMFVDPVIGIGAFNRTAHVEFPDGDIRTAEFRCNRLY